MGFVVHHSVFSTPSSPILFASPRNALSRRKKRAAVACLHQENRKDEDCHSRRAIIYMGFAAIPLLTLRAEAVEGLATPGQLTVCVLVFVL